MVTDKQNRQIEKRKATATRLFNVELTQAIAKVQKKNRKKLIHKAKPLKQIHADIKQVCVCVC